MVLIFMVVRVEVHAPEISVTKSARFDEDKKKTFFVGRVPLAYIAT